MNRDWEAIFTTWSKGPGETEQTRIENTEKQIREAINSSTKLKFRNIKVFTQGSYRNNVNVRKDSDIDIGIVCYDVFFPEYQDDNIKMLLEKSFSSSPEYTYQLFKNEVEEALVARFGRHAVTRGNKAFDIKANTYRVEADVTAFFEHRRYTSANNYLSGVEMIPDNFNGASIKNWPEQHYANGVKKNNETNRHFKRVVRILKNLSNEMASQNIAIANKIPSFLIESLVWNSPNNCFNFNAYKSIVRETLVFLSSKTTSKGESSEWGEISDLKYLFRNSQPWTRQQVNDFVVEAWNYVGFS